MAEKQEISVDQEIHSEHHQEHALPVLNQDPGAAIAATLHHANAVPNPWGRGHIQLYLICSIIYFCSTMNGM